MNNRSRHSNTYMIIHFQAPMMSFGVPEPWYKTRRTDIYPSRSFLTGLIGNSMNLRRSDTDKLQAISDAIEGIRPFYVPTTKGGDPKMAQHPLRLIDDECVDISEAIKDGLAKGFPTANGGIKKVRGKVVTTQLFTKEYIEDAHLVVWMFGKPDFLKKAIHSFEHPLNPLYIGRKCCIPSAPFIQEDEIYTLEENYHGHDIIWF